MNWRGKPLVSLATVVNLIGATWRAACALGDRHPFVPSVTDERMKNHQSHQRA